jgi:cytochrome c biogenesis protein CcdA
MSSETTGKVFRYRLDFYYQQAIFYLLTLIVYVGVRGSLVEDSFTFVLNDPILYVIAIFMLIAFGVLVLNRIRDRKLILTGDRLVFHNRFREREVLVSNIEWMHIGRERRVQTAGRFQMIVVKLKGRRRLLRIRVGRYEREKELVAEMHRIGEKVPRGKKERFGLQRELEV